MSEKEVNDVILENLGIRGFRYLMSLKDNTLTVAKKQRLDGYGIIQMAGSGRVYLQEYLSSSSVARNVSSLTNTSHQRNSGNCK